MNPTDIVAFDFPSNPLNPASWVQEGVEWGLSKFFGMIIDGASWLMAQLFLWIDKMSMFEISTTTVTGANGAQVQSPIAQLWPWMFWLGIVTATGLVLWSIASSAIRRDSQSLGTALFGIVEYTIITTCFVAVVAVLNEIAEAMSGQILSLVPGDGGSADNQWSAVKFAAGDAAQTAEGAGAMVVMAVLAFVSILAGIILFFELAIRQALILILVVTSPIAAAGVMTRSTRSWFSKMWRWTLALIFAKPLIAMALVIGVNLLKWSPGLAGLIGATGVICVAVLAPWGLVRMFSFAETAVASNAMSRGAAASVVTDGMSRVTGKGGVSQASSPGQAAQQSATSSRYESSSSGGKVGSAGRAALNGLHSGYSAAAKMANATTEQLDSSGIGPHVGGPQPSGGGHRSHGGGSGGNMKAASGQISHTRSPSSAGYGMSPAAARSQAKQAATVAAENPEMAAML